MGCLQEPFLNIKAQDSDKLKVKGWRKIFCANTNQKKAVVPILIWTKLIS